MDKEQIKQFMYTLGCDQVHEAVDWIRGTCPLAPFLHSSGKDTNPSFGIKEEIGGAHFHCFTCLSGTPESLVQTLEMYLREQPQYKDRYDLASAKHILENQALNVYKLPDFEAVQQGHQFSEWGTWILDKFPSAMNAQRALDYLMNPKPLPHEERQPHHGRGLTMEEVIYWGFRYDPTRDMVVVPFYNHHGKFAGMRGRSILGGLHHDYTFNHVNNTQLCFLNEQCFQNDEPVVVVEGQFDVAITSRVYPNTVGNLTARMSAEKIRKLSTLDSVILMLDNDDTGRRATEKIAEILVSNGVQVGVAELKGGKDPDQAGEDAIREALKDMLPMLGT